MALGPARRGADASWSAHLPRLTSHRDRSADVLCAATPVACEEGKDRRGGLAVGQDLESHFGRGRNIRFCGYFFLGPDYVDCDIMLV